MNVFTREIEADLIVAHLVLFLHTKKSRVMSFLYNNEGDSRLVPRLQLQTGFADCFQLVRNNLKIKGERARV